MQIVCEGYHFVMTDRDKADAANSGHNDKLIDFMARFTASEQFAKVFQQGMLLVEETADYLDGPGRAQARRLARPAALAYATESMRLTTRLMQMASWLLLQRAISSGEITPEAAEEEQRRVDLEALASQPAQDVEDLPEDLRALMARADYLHQRIRTLDSMVRNREMVADDHPLAGHLDKLAAAFGAR